MSSVLNRWIIEEYENGGYSVTQVKEKEREEYGLSSISEVLFTLRVWMK